MTDRHNTLRQDADGLRDHPGGQVSPDEFTGGSSRAPAPDPAPGTATRRALRCLVTNDDGIDSEGLRRLALLAVEFGLEVTVAAPLQDSSGASAAIIAAEEDGRILIEPRTLAGLEGCEVYGVGALPAFIALAGCRGAFGEPPDIVLSGINSGPNTGHAILHSGTVGAALTASTQGTRALAVSLGVGTGAHWDSAVELARRILPDVLAAPAGTVVNLNAPNVPPAQVRGLHRAPLASFGAVQTNIVESGTGYVKIGVSEIDPTSEPDSDAALLAAGFATVTALRPVCTGAEDGLFAPDIPVAGAVRR